MYENVAPETNTFWVTGCKSEILLRLETLCKKPMDAAPKGEVTKRSFF